MENLSEQLQIIQYVAIAMLLLGGLVGIEREFANKLAGFRTHTLVAGSAALLIGLMDIFVMQSHTAGEYSSVIRTDPIRFVEAIVTGISILGAGTIFRRVEVKAVEGLTTAASILMVGIIGICVSLEQYVLAASVTLICLVVLRIMRVLEGREIPANKD